MIAKMYRIGPMDVFVFICIVIGCIAAVRKRSLTNSGAVFALFLASALYISGGIPFLAALLGFFASTVFFTKLKTTQKEELERILYEKSGVRDHIQVLANGGAALFMSAIHMLAPGQQAIAAVFTAVAACNADSWSSEIGVLSRKKPFSILNFKPIQRGISGGVTFLGLFAGACGAMFIAGIYFVFMLLCIPFRELAVHCMLIALCGFIGAIADSILGAAVQPAYLDSKGRLTEKRMTDGAANKKVKGLEWFSNDMVNFASSLLAACLAYGTWTIFL